jgi:hypothetical protein
MSLREPPAPADRHDLEELELLARELFRGTRGAIRPARALRVVLVAAAAGGPEQSCSTRERAAEVNTRVTPLAGSGSRA